MAIHLDKHFPQLSVEERLYATGHLLRTSSLPPGETLRRASQAIESIDTSSPRTAREHVACRVVDHLRTRLRQYCAPLAP